MWTIFSLGLVFLFVATCNCLQDKNAFDVQEFLQTPVIGVEKYVFHMFLCKLRPSPCYDQCVEFMIKIVFIPSLDLHKLNDPYSEFFGGNQKSGLRLPKEDFKMFSNGLIRPFLKCLYEDCPPSSDKTDQLKKFAASKILYKERFEDIYANYECYQTMFTKSKDQCTNGTCKVRLEQLATEALDPRESLMDIPLRDWDWKVKKIFTNYCKYEICMNDCLFLILDETCPSKAKLLHSINKELTATNIKPFKQGITDIGKKYVWPKECDGLDGAHRPNGFTSFCLSAMFIVAIHLF